MPTLLDGVLETHEGTEPRVIIWDVQSILESAIRPDDEDAGLSVAMVAERANISTRTVYRILKPKKQESIGLDLADRVCLAANSHISECRLVWDDGSITPYRF